MLCTIKYCLCLINLFLRGVKEPVNVEFIDNVNNVFGVLKER